MKRRDGSHYVADKEWREASLSNEEKCNVRRRGNTERDKNSKTAEKGCIRKTGTILTEGDHIKRKRWVLPVLLNATVGSSMKADRYNGSTDRERKFSFCPWCSLTQLSSGHQHHVKVRDMRSYLMWHLKKGQDLYSGLVDTQRAQRA